MEKDEILKRVKASKPNNEYEVQMIFKGLRVGLIGMALLYIVLMFVNTFVLEKQDVSDLTCLVSGFVGISSICAFIQAKKKRFLCIGIGMFILAISTFISFCLGR